MALATKHKHRDKEHKHKNKEHKHCKIDCKKDLVEPIRNVLYWQQLPNRCNIVPPSREIAAVGIFGNRLYQFGGQQDATGIVTCIPLGSEDPVTTIRNTDYNDVWYYDFCDLKWTQVLNIKPDPLFGIPAARTYLGYATWKKGKKLIIYGGLTFNGTSETVCNLVPFSDFWAFDTVEHSWKRLSSNEGPGGRVLPGLAIRKNVVYLFGGVNFQEFQPKNDLWAFNLETNGPWIQLLPNDPLREPLPRFSPDWVYNKKFDVFILHGGDGNIIQQNTLLLDDLWVYDPKTNTFTLKQRNNGPRFRIHGAAATFDNAFLFGFGEIRAVPEEQECNITVVEGDQVLVIEFEGTPNNEIFLTDFTKPNSGYIQLIPTANPPPLKQVSFTQDGDKWYVLNGYTFFCQGPEGGPNSGHLIYNNFIWVLDLKDAKSYLFDSDK